MQLLEGNVAYRTDLATDLTMILCPAFWKIRFSPNDNGELQICPIVFDMLVY